VAQVVQCLPSKHEVLNSNARTDKKKEKKRKKKISLICVANFRIKVMGTWRFIILFLPINLLSIGLAEWLKS
jgi:hypothetical protein